jgi:hypothetical protein
MAELEKRCAELSAAREDQSADGAARVKECINRVLATMKSSGMTSVLVKPMQLMEQDATVRAIKWMETIREKTGVDLFATHHVPVANTHEGREEKRRGKCETSADQAFERSQDDVLLTDVMEQYDVTLGTYGTSLPPEMKNVA